jgi:hypothetical protein
MKVFWDVYLLGYIHFIYFSTIVLICAPRKFKCDIAFIIGNKDMYTAE